MTITQTRNVPRKPDNWLVDVIKHINGSALEQQQIATRARQDSLCILCKGARFLCGKTRCPIMVKVNYFLRSVPLMGEDIDGMSPPSVFIGRIGYPNVYAGPQCRLCMRTRASMICPSGGSASPWMKSWVSAACSSAASTGLT